jgi:secondary thiamine-phosphate synthase enzyme
MSVEISAIVSAVPESIATASLMVATSGSGFTEITREVTGFLAAARVTQGILLMFMRHTNADPVVRTDLVTALARLAPEDGGWVHDVEGADDMPAHVKTMLTGVSLHIPVRDGTLALGTWQGIYVAEHRARPHRREVVLQFIGSKS